LKELMEGRIILSRIELNFYKRIAWDLILFSAPFLQVLKERQSRVDRFGRVYRKTSAGM